jgi:hypothetical protein
LDQARDEPIRQLLPAPVRAEVGSLKKLEGFIHSPAGEGGFAAFDAKDQHDSTSATDILQREQEMRSHPIMRLPIRGQAGAADGRSASLRKASRSRIIRRPRSSISTTFAAPPTADSAVRPVAVASLGVLEDG